MRTASLHAAVLLVLSVVGCVSDRDASDAPPESTRAKPTHELERPFASSSSWNQRVDRRATLDPRSPVLVRELMRQVAAAPPWINTTEYTAPVYSVPPDQTEIRE